MKQKYIRSTSFQLNLLRRRIENLEEDVARLKKENSRLNADLQRARTVSYKLMLVC